MLKAEIGWVIGHLYQILSPIVNMMDKFLKEVKVLLQWAQEW